MNELEKEFVPYQEVLELKRLGFDEPCFGHYDNPENPIWVTLSPPYYANKENVYLAPLYQQAFRWFREKHGLVHGIIIGDIAKFEKGIPSYSGAVWYSKNVNFTHLKNVDYSTYEEAELECLRKLIEICREFVEIIEDKKLSSKSIYDAVEGDLVYSHHGYGGIINSLSKDVRVGIDNYIETAITSETGWETLDINNYKIYDKCYKIIIPKEEHKQGSIVETVKEVISNQLQQVEELRQETQGYICPQTKKQCDDECCVSAEHCHIEASFGIISDCEQPKQETLEEVTVVKRTELYNSILSIVKQIPRKEVEGDAMDAPSCAYELEQLFYKWQAERMYSEEDMINFAWFLKENLGQYSCDKTAHFKGEYLEQFKKK